MRVPLSALVLMTSASLAAADTLAVSPIPDDAESRFCYYAGLAYSENASLTLDVPNRRKGVDEVQKREFVCQRQDGSGTLTWVGIDIERQGLSSN